MGEPVSPAPGMDGLQTWFARVDSNHDGMLTVEEMQADAERFFQELDTNHDGEIDPDEITHYEQDIAPRARGGLLALSEPVASADSNFNRGVSLDEVRAAAAKRFQALDVDHRGTLSVALLESLRPEQPPRPKADDTPVDMDPHAMDPQQH